MAQVSIYGQGAGILSQVSGYWSGCQYNGPGVQTVVQVTKCLQNSSDLWILLQLSGYCSRYMHEDH